jgi:hypothetical protein
VQLDPLPCGAEGTAARNYYSPRDGRSIVKSRLFQYAVILQPDPEDKTGKAELVVPVTTCLATDEGGASLQAARAIPEEYNDRIDRMEVAVRPF